MIKVLRKNVLIEVGQKIEKASELIHLPDWSHRVNRKGRIVRLGERCSKFDERWIGKEVLFHVIKGQGRLLTPEMSKEYGEKEAFHVIALENKVYAVME